MPSFGSLVDSAHQEHDEYYLKLRAASDRLELLRISRKNCIAPEKRLKFRTRISLFLSIRMRRKIAFMRIQDLSH
jgi:hypothetical protein